MIEFLVLDGGQCDSQVTEISASSTQQALTFPGNQDLSLRLVSTAIYVDVVFGLFVPNIRYNYFERISLSYFLLQLDTVSNFNRLSLKFATDGNLTNISN